MEIIYNDDKLIDKWCQNKIKEAAIFCVEQEGLDSNRIEISVSFISNEEIKQLNRQYRNKDSVTDVLSFPQYDRIEDIKMGEWVCLGDIIISLDKANEQACEYGHTLLRELIYLSVHSIFHLLGYDHMTDKEKKVMRYKENYIMEKIRLER